MVGEREDAPDPLPEHPLFRTERWDVMLHMDSYYFDYKTTHLLKFDDVGVAWSFNVTCNVKNYDGEIEAFVDWIMPYCDKYAGDFLGYSRYEETEEPRLIFADKRCELPLAAAAVDPVAGSTTE